MDNGSLEQNRAEGQSMEIDYPDQPQSQSEEQTPRPDFLQQSQSFPIVMAAKAGLQRREFLKEVRQRGKEFKEQQRTAGTVVRMLTIPHMFVTHTCRMGYRDSPQGTPALSSSFRMMSLKCLQG